MQHTTIKLNGLTCHACQTLTQRRIQRIPGVKTVTVDENGAAAITADHQVSAEEVRSALEGTDYTVVTNQS